MNDSLTIAESTRKLCVDTALEAFEDAGLRGLCFEGRWEAAVDAMRSLDLTEIERRSTATRDEV